MRINRLKPQLNRHEIALLLVSMMSPVAGMSAGMLVATQLDHPWQQDAARIIGLVSGLIASLLSGLKLLGNASTREALENLQAGVDRLEAGQDRLLAGQKETNDMLKDLSAGQKETNDMLKDLSAGQKETNDMLKDLSAGQKETNDMLKDLIAGQKETNDMLKENTAVLREILDVLKGGKGDGGGRSGADE